MAEDDAITEVRDSDTGVVRPMGFTVLFGEIGDKWCIKDNVSVEFAFLYNHMTRSSHPLKSIFEPPKVFRDRAKIRSCTN